MGIPRHQTRMPTVPVRYRPFMYEDPDSIDLSELDDEEVFRGQLKNAHGDFRGRPPVAMPRSFYIALQREQYQRFNNKLPELVQQAMATISEVMARKNPTPGDSARIAAAKYVIDRFAGSIPQTVNMNQQVTVNKWDEAVAEVLIDVEEDDD